VLLGGVAGCDRSVAPVAPPPPLDAAATQTVRNRIAFTSSRDGNSEIYVMNADGTDVTRLTDNPAVDKDPAWSPDGGRIAFASNRAGTYDIYVMNADGSGVAQLTTTTTHLGSTRPAWCGNRIAFESDRSIESFPDIYVMNEDGTGVTRLTTANADFDEFPAWSPTCGRIAFTKDPSGNVELYVMNADGTDVTRLTNSVGADEEPAWSPDGTRIAFMSTRDGQAEHQEIYVMNADGTGVVRLTDNTAQDSKPTWSPDGSRIGFQSNRDGDYEIYVMNADGSGVAQLTDNAAADVSPAWVGIPGQSAVDWPNEPANSMLLNDQRWTCDSPLMFERLCDGWAYLRRGSSQDADIGADVTAPFSPDSVLRIIFTPDMPANTEPGVNWIDWPDVPGVEEIYVAWWMKLSPNWTSSPVGSGIGFLRAQDGGGQVYTGLYHPCAWPESEATCSPQADGPPYKIGVQTLWEPFESQGVGGVWYPNVHTTWINPGEWHRVEFYYRWETAPGPNAGDGSRDGIIRWWVDGILNGNHTNVEYPTLRGFEQFEFAPTQQYPPPPGVTTYMYIDHTHISTVR